MLERISGKGKGKSGKALRHLELIFPIVLTVLKPDFANLVSNHSKGGWELAVPESGYRSRAYLFQHPYVGLRTPRGTVSKQGLE